MNAFDVFSPDGHTITWETSLPAAYTKLAIPGTTPYVARCSFGDMLFQHIPGEGFDIWKSNYLVNRDAKVTGRMNAPILEFSVMYENSFSIDWKGVTNSRLAPKSMDLFFAPHVDNTTSFTGGRQFTTVDFHYHAAMLETYCHDFPALGRFMEKVHKGEPARLFEGRPLSSPAIDQLVKMMMGSTVSDTLAGRYFDSYAHLVLAHFLERTKETGKKVFLFSESDIEKTREAHRLLTMEIEECYTIKELCKKLYTNPFKLKNCFRHLYGTSIGRYKKTILMEKAKVLLQETDYSLDEIAMRLGYNSQTNFSTAFRNYYKVVPSVWRKMR